jgi:hypothetical protein
MAGCMILGLGYYMNSDLKQTLRDTYYTSVINFGIIAFAENTDNLFAVITVTGLSAWLVYRQINKSLTS